MGQVRNTSEVKVIDNTDGSNNKVGDIGIVQDYCGDLASQGGFRVVVQGRPTYGNWHSIDEVKVLKY